MLFSTCYLRLGGVCKFMPPGKVDIVHEVAEEEGRVILRLAGAGGDILKLAGGVGLYIWEGLLIF